MSFHSADLEAVTSGRFIVPGDEMPADLWLDYAKIRLLEPEPKLLDVWMQRLSRRIENWQVQPWSVLRVKPNMERRVAAALGPRSDENPFGAGIAVYHPREKYRPRRTWKSRTRPLMPGYLFAELPDDDALDTARSNHSVLEVMCQDGHPVMIPALVVGAFALMEWAGAFDTTWNSPPPLRDKRRGRRPTRKVWAKGQRAKVAEGPFSGFVAEIVNADRADRIEAFVNLFGRVTSIMLDEEMLEEIG